MTAISRRTLVTTGASLLASSASLMMLRGVEASPHTAATSEPHMTEELRKCIHLCQDCHTLCVQMIGQCLRLGGRHAAHDHIRVLMDCAQMCMIAADYLTRESVIHGRVCGVCAEICRLCAESCEQVAADDQLVKRCAEMCRRCADSCKHMASKEAV